MQMKFGSPQPFTRAAIFDIWKEMIRRKRRKDPKVFPADPKELHVTPRQWKELTQFSHDEYGGKMPEGGPKELMGVPITSTTAAEFTMIW
jgi:hypothetical protein